VEYLNLGDQPPSNSFIEPAGIESEKKFPLRVVLCTDCGLSQLDTVVSVKEIFDEYAYRSSTSRALKESFKELASRVTSLNFRSSIRSKKLVVDVGCNDGYLLKQFDPAEYKLLGIEPSSAATDAIAAGFVVERCFFGIETARELREKYGQADYILVTNVLAHVPNIKSFVQGVAHWLSDDGFFYVEFPYILDMVENRSFDTIYHEHLSYLSITPLVTLFKEFGLEIVDIEKCEIGGSGPFLRVSSKKELYEFPIESEKVAHYLFNEANFDICNPDSYKIFSQEVFELKEVIFEQLLKWKNQGFMIGGFGAPAKGNTLLNFLKLDTSIISFIADNTPEKIGRITPGSHIPIISDIEFEELRLDVALLLSWNYLEYFLKNSSYVKKGGAFYVPFPIPRVYGELGRTI
jgi:SAM-dependent methyltransferase